MGNLQKSATVKVHDLKTDGLVILRFEYTPLKQNDAKNLFLILIDSNEEEVRDGAIRVISYNFFYADCPVLRNVLIFENKTTR